jgi:DNA-binding Xre family transcriptional regulator
MTRRRVKRLRISEMVERYNASHKDQFTITTLAKSIGVPHNTLFNYDRGKSEDPFFTVIDAVCRALECTSEQLVEWQEELSSAWSALATQLAR